MSNKVIVYQSEDGLKIVVPTPEYLNGNTIEDLAKKDVPPNIPYHIIDISELPADRTFRGAWVWE